MIYPDQLTELLLAWLAWAAILRIYQLSEDLRFIQWTCRTVEGMLQALIEVSQFNRREFVRTIRTQQDEIQLHLKQLAMQEIELRSLREHKRSSVNVKNGKGKIKIIK